MKPARVDGIAENVRSEQAEVSHGVGPGRPRISVCMAVHNGAKFIVEQVGSILPQLSTGDELVVVDDASTDSGISAIESFHDERIRILRQPENRGVVPTFAHAFTAARGEIIFLADQDDVWDSGKVQKVLDVFARDPDVTLVMTNLVMIDGAGNRISGPKFGQRKFRAGILRNLVRNQYQGSAMAVRRSALEYCLPFPDDVPMHDVWIGLVNQFVGRAAFIEEPLLLYRRHGSNDSPDRHAPIPRMIRWRWSLVRNLCLLYLRRIAFRRK